MRHESERESARATGGRTRFFAPHPNPDRSRSAEQQSVGCRLMVRGRRAQSQWTLSRQMARRASVSATLASPTWTTVVMETHSMRQSWMPPSSATLSRRYERVGCTCRAASSLNSRGGGLRMYPHSRRPWMMRCGVRGPHFTCCWIEQFALHGLWLLYCLSLVALQCKCRI